MLKHDECQADICISSCPYTVFTHRRREAAILVFTEMLILELPSESKKHNLEQFTRSALHQIPFLLYLL